MSRRMKDLLALYKDIASQSWTPEEARTHRERLLVQIQFFQHERLIHLIVTVLFALLTVITLFVSLVVAQPLLLVLFALFMILLVPYIKHYYLLENGVQQLYQYYDALDSMVI